MRYSFTSNNILSDNYIIFIVDFRHKTLVGFYEKLIVRSFDPNFFTCYTRLFKGKDNFKSANKIS